MNLKTEYDQDFQQWIEHHIALLKARRLEELDVEHLVDELEDMGKSNVRELRNRLVILIAHLLKWEYQLSQLQNQLENFTGNSWQGTIIVQRDHLIDLLESNPSLKRFTTDAIAEAYPRALKIAVKETGLSVSVFPKTCPYSYEQLLDEDFYPQSNRI